MEMWFLPSDKRYLYITYNNENVYLHSLKGEKQDEEKANDISR